LALREVGEYAELAARRAIKDDALRYVATSAASLADRDHGLGSVEARKQIRELLDKPDELKKPAKLNALEEATLRAESQYLQTWASHVEAQGISYEAVELLARSVAAHLVDSGYAPGHLHRWLKNVLSADELSLVDVLASAQTMVARSDVAYDVLVPFVKLPSGAIKSARTAERFLTHEEMIAKSEALGVDPPHVRAGAGCLTFQVTAREPRAALILVDEEIRQLRARAVVGDPGERAEPQGVALVMNAASPRWQSLPKTTGVIFLATLRDHSGLLPATGRASSKLDDCLELLATVESTSSWSSVSAMWAAIEGMLINEPNEAGVTAADRGGSIVACSFPRAELTSLRKNAEPSSPAKPLEHDGLLDGIRQGTVTFEEASDAAAANRLRALHSAPAPTMKRIERYASESFRRLYNQRNLVLHGASFDSVALKATMRTLPSLTGALFDRMVHGLASEPATTPPRLAARAQNTIALLGTPAASPLWALLD
jgi:hypothetical protein